MRRRTIITVCTIIAGTVIVSGVVWLRCNPQARVNWHMHLSFAAYERGEYEKDEEHLLAALEIAEAHGLKDATLAENVFTAADMWQHRGQPERAESLFVRGWDLFQRIYGDDAQERLIGPLAMLTDFYKNQQEYGTALQYSNRLIECCLNRYGSGPVGTGMACVFDEHADLLRKLGRDEEAEQFEARASEIRATGWKNNQPDNPGQGSPEAPDGEEG
jgi:tetratricopeptide (TPR) repeat protein